MSHFPQIPEDLHPNPPGLSGKEYHVYIAHDSADLEVAQELNSKLENFGYNCTYTENGLTFGLPIVQETQRIIERSKRTVVILSSSMKNNDCLMKLVGQCKDEENKRGKNLLVPILYKTTDHGIPPDLMQYQPFQTEDETFWKLLFQALDNVICINNIAMGLAWSFYYGYICTVLPDLGVKIDASQYEGKDLKKCYKLFIMIPKSCKMPVELTEHDNRFSEHGVIKYTKERASKSRDYEIHLYKIQEPDTHKEYLCPIVFADTLEVMYKMEQQGHLNCKEKYHQVEMFEKKLDEILNSMNTRCKDRAVLLTYEDGDTIFDHVLRYLQADSSLLTKPTT